jgi:hypothetical protein|nr:MAG TPA: hypothetical protein [Caudoviricetes sp.]
MRFALRNKAKLIKSFGEDYYKLLVSSLTAFAKSSREIAAYTVEGYTYEFINIPNVQPSADSYFQFAIVGRQYDVIHVAYYSAIG